jgi:RNA polymerase sigma-70 factor (ECF subfamily)
MFNNQDLITESEKLQKFAYKLTQNKSDADDLLQSTLLRAIEKKHLFQDGTNLFSWSSKIMYNMFVSAYRRRTKFETQYDPESYIERESVEASQDVKMELNDVEDAMNNISEDHREILTLVCVKGMQYAEVSESLQIPVGTVRSRLSRAREALMSEMSVMKKTTTFMPPALAYKNGGAQMAA